jgi:hypothetical protein
MTHAARLSLTATALVAMHLMACDTAPTDPEASPSPAFANNGSARVPIDMAISDIATGLHSDGKGDYTDQDCGVYAWLDGLAFMNPDASRIPRSDQQRCGDGRHAYAHIEGTDHELANIMLRADDLQNPASAVGTVNAGTACLFVQGKKVSGKGLRFNPTDHPGSDALNVTLAADGSWRFWTKNYPDNKGWCEDESGVRLVHFDLDVTVRVQ